MTFAFNIFDEAAEDTRFVQKAIDSYRTPASKFNLTIKLRGVSSHCIEVGFTTDFFRAVFSSFKILK